MSYSSTLLQTLSYRLSTIELYQVGKKLSNVLQSLSSCVRHPISGDDVYRCGSQFVCDDIHRTPLSEHGLVSTV